MADTTTATYSLVKPEISASENTWGTKLNTNLDSIDKLLDGTTVVTGIKMDDTASMVDNADNTKVAQFQVSGITTGTTRTFTFPDASGTLALTSAPITSIEGLTTAADKMIYTTAADTYAVTDLTSFARTLLDDADAATARGTLGLEIGTDVQAQNTNLADLATNGFATASDYRAATTDKTLKADIVWDAMAEVTLTDAANISLDLATGYDFAVTLGGNRTLDNPTNVTVGQKGRITVIQDGTGSRTLSFGSNYKFAGGNAPVLTATASAIDVLYYDCRATGFIFISAAGDVK